MSLQAIANVLHLDYVECCYWFNNIELLTTQGVRRLLDNPFGTDVYAGTSGGKDSSVICDLYLRYCEQAQIKPQIIHNKKTIVDPLTVKHLYSLSYPIIYCSSADTKNCTDRTIQVDGSRIAECSRTNGRSTDFICNGQSINRKDMTLYNARGLFDLRFIYPIYDWSDEQVWTYIYAHKLPVSEEYPFYALFDYSTSL